MRRCAAATALPRHKCDHGTKHLFDFKPDSSLEKPESYRQLREAVDALTADEPDTVANMANVAALIWEFVPDLNWAGFYRMGSNSSAEEELVLGPFVGRPACIRIPIGKGVCGAAVSQRATQLVEDVHAFPGHIACDAVSRSELVVPVVLDGKVIAVIDLDSPTPARFDDQDAQGIEAVANLLSDRI